MFAYPLLPRLPSYFQPSALLAPIQTILSRPRVIDYSSIAPLPTGSGDTGKSTAAHSGALANLPLDTCPICHLRSTSTPVPLTSSLNIALPPVGSGEIEGLSEENRIFVPAQSDCWGNCRWCYYCIMGELASQTQNHTEGSEKGEASRWDCLRCGGSVTRAWRVGPDPVEQVDEITEKPAQ